ncbi:MAG: penicillin-binding protein 2 [Alphaproteobacteria bacterium]|nr:penicillin-binding protein 2 [Alphaproteobacteria bacterium]
MILRQMRRNAIRIEGEHSAALERARGRLVLLGMVFALAYAVIAVRVFDLAVLQGDVPRMEGEVVAADEGLQEKEQVASIRRGDIYDRNGELLATTLKAASLYADPALILEPQKVTQRLARIFPDLDQAQTLKDLEGARRFAWIRRGITPDQQQEILALGEPGLGFEYEDTRIYPQGALATHLVGYADRDGNGLAGVERSYQDVLATGNDLHLTLDLRLQHALRRELGAAVQEFQAIGAAGVILDAQTGEVLAGVSLPDFDINKAGSATDEQEFSRLTLGVYELGSMFKIFSTAALLETVNGSLGQTFDATKPIRIGRFSINDYHAQKRVLTVPEVFMYSSNIGAALMGKTVGTEKLRAFYRDLGLIDPLKFDVREIGSPEVPHPWREASTLTASYGHGISTTPLQLASAAASVVNGGFLVQPKLVAQQDNSGEPEKKVRVISQENSEKMRALWRLVVTQGTAKNADVPGYDIGGKTGTAEKVGARGGYDRKRLISSFVGAFPMNDPKYVVMIMVDEPKGNKKTYGYATAGWVAAPVMAKVVTSMASILGIPADAYDPAKDIVYNLDRYIHDPKHKKGKTLVSYHE